MNWRPWRWPILTALLIGLGYGALVLAQTPTSAVGVYYVGPEDQIAEAIRLNAPYIVRVDQPELAQVLVLNNAPLTHETLRDFGREIKSGDLGLVLFVGPDFPEDIAELNALLGVSTFGMARMEATRELRPAEAYDPLRESINWRSAPAIHARTVISNPNLLRPIVTTTANEPFLQRLRGQEERQAFFVSGWLGHESNAAWLNWPYFDYFIYRLIAEAAQTPRIFSFGNYSYAPVPKGRLRLGLAGGSGALLLLTWGIFFLARRRLFLHPEALTTLRIRALRSAESAEPSEASAEATSWHSVGFHRPLAGFFTLFGVGSLIFLPLLAYHEFALPQWLLPWPQTLRFWDQVVRWLTIVAILFDVRTGTAAVRYFAAARGRRPEQAFRYFQAYLWWQMISGALQLSIIGLLSALVFPNTALAHLSFYFVFRAILQFPGFLRIFHLFFRANQRLDYAQILTLVTVVSPLVIQSALILVGRRWGALDLVLSDALGGVLGLSLGIYLSEWLGFAVGLWLYRKLGYAPRALLLPAFDREVLKRLLNFGARLTLGTLASALSWIALPQILPSDAVAPSPWMLLLAYEVLAQGLYAGLTPAIAEAHVQGYQTLARYYASEGLHYGLWMGFYLLALLSALGETLILRGFGEPSEEAVGLLGPVLLWGALQGIIWGADRVWEATGYPLLKSVVQIGAEALTLGLIIVLTASWGIWSRVLAMFVVLLIRGAVSWLLIRRYIWRPRLVIWQTWIAPAGAAVLLYNLLRTIDDLYLRALPFSPARSYLIALGVLLFTLPTYSFLTAFFGGWDPGGVQELQRAAALSGPGKPIAWLLTWGVRVGAQASPLHGHFPMALRGIAAEEAWALTLGRTQID
ncbi:MAG: lipopolysaccharide biosynthesis protein [Anaerolineales bacterium]